LERGGVGVEDAYQVKLEMTTEVMHTAIKKSLHIRSAGYTRPAAVSLSEVPELVGHIEQRERALVCRCPTGIEKD
jgi:hypothetical protein